MIAPDLLAAQNQITNTFNANATTTSWVHSLENCVLPLLTPAPSWFTDLNAALKSAQENAMSWLQETSPKLFSASTQSYIDYANTFKVTVGPGATQTLSSLVTEIQAAGNIPTAQQQQLLTVMVQALLKVATAQQAIAVDLQAQMDTFRQQTLADHQLIENGVASAVQETSQDSAKIQALQNSIQELMLQLTADNTKVANSNVSYGSAIFSTVIGLTFGVAMSGGMLGIGVVIGAVISIGSALTSDIIYTDALKQDIANISALLSQLPQAEQQLVLAQSIVSNLEALSETNDAALQTFANLTDIWASTVDDLEWLLVVLAQPQIDVSKIPALTSLTAANGVWQNVLSFATQAQNLSLQQTPVLTLPSATIIPLANYTQRKTGATAAQATTAKATA